MEMNVKQIILKDWLITQGNFIDSIIEISESYESVPEDIDIIYRSLSEKERLLVFSAVIKDILNQNDFS